MRLAPLFALALLSCGTGEGKPPDHPDRPMISPEAEMAAPKTTSLRRSQVKGAINRGLGVFFQNVLVDDAQRNGKFVGWRVQRMNPEWNTDIQPGDIITKVNGMPVESPDQADAALRSLEKASALRVEYEREGKPRVLELPITDDAIGQENRAR